MFGILDGPLLRGSGLLIAIGTTIGRPIHLDGDLLRGSGLLISSSRNIHVVGVIEVHDGQSWHVPGVLTEHHGT